jgi:hypothetical protein
MLMVMAFDMKATIPMQADFQTKPNFEQKAGVHSNKARHC